MLRIFRVTDARLVSKPMDPPPPPKLEVEFGNISELALQPGDELMKMPEVKKGGVLQYAIWYKNGQGAWDFWGMAADEDELLWEKKQARIAGRAFHYTPVVMPK
jgi:hypothetical protein